MDPCTKSVTASRQPQIATQLLNDFFPFKSYASFDTNFAKIGLSVARSCDVLYSHVGTKFAQNPHFALCLCTKHMMEITDFLKMH